MSIFGSRFGRSFGRSSPFSFGLNERVAFARQGGLFSEIDIGEELGDIFDGSNIGDNFNDFLDQLTARGGTELLEAIFGEDRADQLQSRDRADDVGRNPDDSELILAGRQFSGLSIFVVGGGIVVALILLIAVIFSN